MQFKKDIIRLVKKHIKIDESLLEIPPNPEMGDYALPCFSLAKQKKQAPNKIAEDLAKKIKPTKTITKIQNIGPYINFFISKEAIAKQVLSTINKEKLNYGKNNNKNKIMLEYPSPNTNKPLHLGHIRNILLGNSVRNILKKQGNKVTITNLYNDRGIAITKAMLVYKKWGKNKTPKSEGTKPDAFIGDYYVMFSKKKTPKLEKEAQDLLVKWEDNDKETRALWKKLMKWVYQGYKGTLNKLDYYEDKAYYESDIYDKGKDIVNKGLKKGIFEKDETGAVFARLEKYKLPDKVLLRSDGTTVYMTQDLYLAIQKFKDFKIDKSIYVVASEQKMHFQMLFAILDQLGYKGVEKCFHLSYGMVFLPTGRMKSREGTVVDADDLIEEIKSIAKIEIEKRHKLTKKEIEKRAKQIGMGALVFHMLKIDPNKDMLYDPEESIAFEGDTGPYVQYAHARCVSILKKAKTKITKEVDFKLLTTTQEQELIKILMKYPSVLEDAAKHYKPSLIANYLLTLTQRFNDFYQFCPCLSTKKEEKKARLLLVDCSRLVLENGLNLLGIEAPTAM